MSRPQTPEDNGLEESFHGHLKGDYLRLREAESFPETRTTIATSITDYNEVPSALIVELHDAQGIRPEET
jgi:transposase InsO family protein